MQIRMLTESGRQTFEEYLRTRKSGEEVEVPSDLLTDEEQSEPAPFSAEIEKIGFDNRRHMARYLYEKIGERAGALGRSPGLWSWLALFYIEQLVPEGEKPRQLERYVVHGDETFRTYHRHQVYGPFTLYHLHGDTARGLLVQDVKIHPDMAEQCAARQKVITNPALMEIVDRLYFDTEAASNKSGATSRNRGGTLRRLIDMADQFDLTYDTYGMSADDIMELLPSEFDEWKPQPVEAAS